ncbi:hypothetical protein EVAR_14849_1 [Eumeta japonica]|uniref:Uncharacterized protein n=1 Tax=Eumeta variegata TaxID=151549 RepID=A0A4C1V2Y2_EUMVA|nr:hypothetical protein EVAR_14849_1 [Eumeta japonica]
MITKNNLIRVFLTPPPYYRRASSIKVSLNASPNVLDSILPRYERHRELVATLAWRARPIDRDHRFWSRHCYTDDVMTSAAPNPSRSSVEDDHIKLNLPPKWLPIYCFHSIRLDGCHMGHQPTRPLQPLGCYPLKRKHCKV